ncbi:28S ribosomal protein S18c, mitochondrial [Cimex lectularius]|uniref:Mitochondrial ribosomal protein S18C n=1 Tax=Cimex lectularius TaxID=79782 RepID=A0A8I6TGG2_CIMLE|nr:28S ribosomal protein S18c, mitochondrial [Cimex lectularius]XP_014255637.1 28S ribosomal protein S18c, mitochondrial [Cimex lectularius]
MSFLKLALVTTSRIFARRQFVTSSQLLNDSASRNDSSDDMPVEMPNPFQKEKQVCILCKMKIDPDFKNVKLLSQFVSPFTGRLYGRHITGLCKLKQEAVAREINKAQQACLMPYWNKQPEFVDDPKLYNSEKPIRMHRF